MKITQIMLSKGYGGGERYFEDLAVALAAGGHEVQALVHSRYVGVSALGAHAGIRVDALPSRGMWDRWALGRMTRAIERFVPDVMHSHMARAAWAGGKAAARHGFPLIATTHNYVDLKYYRHVHGFIPTTRDQAAYLRGEGVAPERIHRIPNFSALAPAAAVRERGPGPPTFVAYGRMVEKKGFQDLLPALAALRDAGLACRLLLGGDGPDLPAMRALADSLDLSRIVHFAGWVDDVAAFLARGDVFVLPSRDEPFGIVMLEAMAAAIPIVTTRTQGPSEVLDDDTAWYAEIADPVSLAASLRAAAGDPDGARERAARALRRYREQYHESAVVPRIVALYEQVASTTAERR